MSEADPQPTAESPACSPFVEQLCVPQFGIIHLMLWTAVTAVLLAYFLALRGESINHIPTPSRWLFQISQTIDAIMLASALVGSGVLIRARCYSILTKLQPGHWLTLIVSLDFVFQLAVRLLYRFLNLHGIEPRSILTTQSGAVVTGTLIAAVYILAFTKLRDAKRWRILFGAKMLGAGVNAVVNLIFLVTILSTAWPSSVMWISFFPGIWFVVVFIMLITVAVLDLRGRTPRDWLHWLGVGVVVGENVWPLQRFCAFRFRIF
jgi:hypothetical protein